MEGASFFQLQREMATVVVLMNQEKKKPEQSIDNVRTLADYIEVRLKESLLLSFCRRRYRHHHLPDKLSMPHTQATVANLQPTRSNFTDDVSGRKGFPDWSLVVPSSLSLPLSEKDGSPGRLPVGDKFTSQGGW
jgi:hypothetical protein